jgi:hypothetical protein
VYVVGSTNDTVYQYNTATKSAKFDVETFYLPKDLQVIGNLDVGGATLLNGALLVQSGATFNSGVVVNGTLTANGNIALTGGATTANTFGTIATTGTTTIGGTAQTGTITVGQSTASNTTNIQAGATTSGNTKTINFGTAGLSGSTTSISIGSAVSGATTNVTANGTWTYANTIVGSINGNAATVTDGVVTTGAYADPSWITSLNYSKLTGTVPTWNQNTTGTAAGITGKTTPSGALVGTSDTQTLTNKTITFADNTLTGVQATLVSGTNIKTINGSSILGSGDLDIEGGSGGITTGKAIAMAIVFG